MVIRFFWCWSFILLRRGRGHVFIVCHGRRLLETVTAVRLSALRRLIYGFASASQRHKRLPVVAQASIVFLHITLSGPQISMIFVKRWVPGVRVHAHLVLRGLLLIDLVALMRAFQRRPVRRGLLALAEDLSLEVLEGDHDDSHVV